MSSGHTALHEYEDWIKVYGQQLGNHVADTTGDFLDVTSWFLWLSFDLIGDFASSRSLSTLEDAQRHAAMILMRTGMALLRYMSPLPWLARLAFSTPAVKVVRERNTMVEWCRLRMAE